MEDLNQRGTIWRDGKIKLSSRRESFWIETWRLVPLLTNFLQLFYFFFTFLSSLNPFRSCQTNTLGIFPGWKKGKPVALNSTNQEVVLYILVSERYWYGITFKCLCLDPPSPQGIDRLCVVKKKETNKHHFEKREQLKYTFIVYMSILAP